MNSIQIYTSKDQIELSKWESLLARSPYASFFQSPECYDFYQSLSFLEPFVFAVSENEMLVGLVCGYLTAEKGKLKSYFSRRAIVPGGILLSNDISEKVLLLLLHETIIQLEKKSIYIEIRNFNDYDQYKSVFSLQNFIYKPHLNIQIKISHTQNPFFELSKSKQRQVKWSLKNGIYYDVATKIEDISQFYGVLSHLYQTKIKRPLFPLEFFIKLSKLPNGRVILIKKDRTVIGGIACVMDQKSLYEWFICGDDITYKKDYPSVMATWAGIEYASCQNSLHTFDFMGAGRPSDSYGVRKFKSKFGGDMVEYGRFLYVCNRMLYGLGNLVIQTNSKIVL